MSVAGRRFFQIVKEQVSPVQCAVSVHFQILVGWCDKLKVNVGDVYNYLEVVERVGTKKNKTPIWKCKCLRCGSFTKVSSEHLKNGNTKSCGCLRSYLNSCKKSFINHFEIHNEITYGFDVLGNRFIIDTEDLDRVKRFYWHKGVRGYFISQTPYKQNLHRFIMNTPSNMVCDHLFHDVSDNRKSQLRNCSQYENKQNSKLYKSNTSGIKEFIKSEISLELK